MVGMWKREWMMCLGDESASCAPWCCACAVTLELRRSCVLGLPPCLGRARQGVAGRGKGHSRAGVTASFPFHPRPAQRGHRRMLALRCAAPNMTPQSTTNHNTRQVLLHYHPPRHFLVYRCAADVMSASQRWHHV